MREKKQPGLLERLTQEMRCEFLSDLKQEVATNRSRAAQCIQKISSQEFSLKEWCDSYHYLFGKSVSFEEVEQVKQALVQQLLK